MIQVRSSPVRVDASVLERIALGSPAFLRDHLSDTASLADGWAGHSGMAQADRECFRIAALFHDIGKLALPSDLLLKASKLERVEFELICEHVGFGARMVMPFVAARIVRIIMQHHERIDGRGYPEGLPGAAIDPLARRLSIVDAFSAMRESRPYQRARTDVEALAELRRCAGAQFDREYVAEFVTWREGIV